MESKEIKELQDKINKLDTEIKIMEKIILSSIVESILPNKCDSCGCYDGIHKNNCYFIIKIN